MEANRESSRRRVCFICVLLALFCLLLGFLPYSHHCGEAECAVCSLIETGGVACVLALCAFFYRIRIISNSGLPFEDGVTALAAFTLVGHKVKLSD